LLRNLSIIVLIPAAAWLVRREEAALEAGPQDTEQGARVGSQDPRVAGAPLRAPKTSAVPFFVFAFILFVVIRTVGDGMFQAAPVWHAAVNTGQSASELFLVCGMTAVGLSVSFNDMWRIGWRPLAAGFLVATLVGVCSLALTLGMYRFFR
jgi:uncharacterized membrane protein YadS